MRVAIYGGSFNPPHVAHQLAALYVLETQPVDELWFVPCFKHPFEKALESFEDRLEMCRRAAAPLGPLGLDLPDVVRPSLRDVSFHSTTVSAQLPTSE